MPIYSSSLDRTRIISDPEHRAAVLHLRDAMERAQATKDYQTLGQMEIPAILGPECGGGQTFNTLTPAHLKALSDVMQELAIVLMAEQAERPQAPPTRH